MVTRPLVGKPVRVDVLVGVDGVRGGHRAVALARSRSRRRRPRCGCRSRGSGCRHRGVRWSSTSRTATSHARPTSGRAARGRRSSSRSSPDEHLAVDLARDLVAGRGAVVVRRRRRSPTRGRCRAATRSPTGTSAYSAAGSSTPSPKASLPTRPVVERGLARVVGPQAVRADLEPGRRGHRHFEVGRRRRSVATDRRRTRGTTPHPGSDTDRAAPIHRPTRRRRRSRSTTTRPTALPGPGWWRPSSLGAIVDRSLTRSARSSRPRPSPALSPSMAESIWYATSGRSRGTVQSSSSVDAGLLSERPQEREVHVGAAADLLVALHRRDAPVVLRLRGAHRGDDRVELVERHRTQLARRATVRREQTERHEVVEVVDRFVVRRAEVGDGEVDVFEHERRGEVLVRHVLRDIAPPEVALREPVEVAHEQLAVRMCLAPCTDRCRSSRRGCRSTAGTDT